MVAGGCKGNEVKRKVPRLRSASLRSASLRSG